ncbi:MAG TPA: hypothetical protein VLA97_11240 [Nocardioidaceae bacterium]|jgi:hypothetical protein|nr:hypothetical protein [Nocardioidaceae bacterium]
MSGLLEVGGTELASQAARLLPRRETLCSVGCVDVANVIGVNVAVAVNAASIGTTAEALATQQLSADQ